MSFIKTYLSLKRNSTYINGNETAYIMMKSVACYGLPKVLVSDNGTRFTSQEFTQLCSGCGIKRKFIYSSLSPLNKACTNNKECLKDCFSAQRQCTVH